MSKVHQVRQDALEAVARRIFINSTPLTSREAEELAKAVKRENQQNRNE